MWKNKWYAFGFVKDLEYSPYILPIDLLIKDVKFSNNKFILSKIKYTNEYGPSFFDDIISLASNIYTKNLKPINGIRNFLKNTNYNIIIGSNSIKLRVIEGLKTTNLKNFFDEEKN